MFKNQQVETVYGNEYTEINIKEVHINELFDELPLPESDSKQKPGIMSIEINPNDETTTYLLK